MKKINIISVGTFDIPEWDIVWEILDSAGEIITYKKLDHIASSEREIQDCDAFIFLDMASIYRDRPFIYINKTDSEDDIVEKMQLLATKVMSPPEEIKEEPSEPEVIIHENSSSITVDLDEITDEITADEMDKLRFNQFEIEINGTVVRLTKADILTLSKMQKLMKVYGYKIKKVVHDSPK